jgi:acyl-[acyl-carrier-protein]-phospholipid O-acyltransferase/long-chain-fatty-acid--[acyl-carrier-protein] ligase
MNDPRSNVLDSHSGTARGGTAVKWVLRLVTRLLFRVRFSGDASAFLNERTLIVANHESFLDGLLLGIFLPVDATFVVHTQVVRNPAIAWLLRFIPHLAVDSTSPLAIKLICKLVETGRPVIIFPEGRLTVTGSLMKVYDGAAFIAARTGATVVPVRIEGAGRSYFGRLAGIYPLKVLPRISITVMPRRSIPMPALPSATITDRAGASIAATVIGFGACLAASIAGSWLYGLRSKTNDMSVLSRD